MLVPNWTLMDVGLVPDAAALSGDWDELVRRCLVPAGLNSPELVSCALALQPGLRLATVRDSGGLRLAMPVVHRRFPWPLLSSAATAISFPGLPHLDAAMAVPALNALLRRLASPVLLRGVPLHGAFWEAVHAATGHVAVLSQWERAALDIAGTYEQWFERNFDRKRRKEYRRLEARLGEQGEFSALSLDPDVDPSPWIAEFLVLEAAGWKGRRGTAIVDEPAAAAQFARACTALASSGKLRFWKLTLDGRAIAMLYAIVEGNHAWLGKIAYDEGLARFSPGVLQVLHATQSLFAEGGIAHADSCADPGHPMIDHIWRGRLAVADVLIAPGNFGAARFACLAGAERQRIRIRGAAKTAFHKLTGRNRP